ncbi:MAG: 50S ribosomal protein L22 [Candidatus Micrarchaeota archaeon]|nr:50S ribosomal protein L22 [Candidatus Micrarchaeota archaeon]
MRYSYNLDRKGIVFASGHDINASFKDLCAVCDAIRYRPVPSALRILDGVIDGGMAIEFRRHNKYMGSRHELHGKKGRYPKKCASIVKKVLVNSAANARGKGEDPDYMYVVHASANKTYEVMRIPSKGTRAVRSGGYGYTKMRRSNLDFAKLEIGIAEKGKLELGARMKRALASTSKMEKIVEKPAVNAKQQKKETTKATEKPATQKKPPEVPKPAKEAKANNNTVKESDQKGDGTKKV